MSRRPSPCYRKIVPIKRADGEPLTRSDLQYDFLHNIFSNTKAVFTDPWHNHGVSDTVKLTFRDLYVKTLLNSTKATKAFRDKLVESAVFAEDFAMIALLVNVGRINTTMSFFPEMKTAIRSYHPVPALQRTSGNLQDAPRIKHILKAVTVEDESRDQPMVPADILSRQAAGSIPPTTVTNLIFILANHSGSVGHAHFPDNVEFLDLFMRTDISSVSRAQAFLWICFNYLESTSFDSEDHYDNDALVNPFGDSRKGGKPSFVHLTAEEVALENADPDDETKLAEKLMQHRGRLLQGLQSKEKSASSTGDFPIADADDQTTPGGEDKSTAVPRGKRKRDHTTAAKSDPSTAIKEKKPTKEKVSKAKKQKTKATEELTTPDGDDLSRPPVARGARGARIIAVRGLHQGERSSNINQQDELDLNGSPDDHYSSYSREYAAIRRSSDIYNAARSRRSVPQWTMLQYAWHKVTTLDPLVDSDDEVGDEHMRHEYMQRLRVVAQLIGTPIADSEQPSRDGSVLPLPSV